MYLQVVTSIIQVLKKSKNPVDCVNNRQGILKIKTRLLASIFGKSIVSQSPQKGKNTMEPREIKGLEIAASPCWRRLPETVSS